MSRDDFINNVTKKLSALGFNRIEDCWIRQIIQQSNITVNGQPMGRDVVTDLKISIFADAKIDDEDAAQMLFEADINGRSILEYEEIIPYNSFDIIEQICQMLFRI